MNRRGFLRFLRGAPAGAAGAAATIFAAEAVREPSDPVVHAGEQKCWACGCPMHHAIAVNEPMMMAGPAPSPWVHPSHQPQGHVTWSSKAKEVCSWCGTAWVEPWRPDASAV